MDLNNIGSGWWKDWIPVLVADRSRAPNPRLATVRHELVLLRFYCARGAMAMRSASPSFTGGYGRKPLRGH